MTFELMLFYTNETFTRSAVQAGVSGVIVDWERRGKEIRQRNFDTQINRHTADDLRQARACTFAYLICRVNGPSPSTPEEIDTAINLGADEILLPYVHTLEEVESSLEHIRGRCNLGVMIETVAAVTLAQDFNQYPLARIYVGLNDLGIERRTRHIFVAVADGTVERVRRAIWGHPFGFAGLTLPDCGTPLPCRLLIAEMARLDCHFSFLRRSFYRDIQGRAVDVEIPRILEAIQQAQMRPPEQVESGRAELIQAITQLPDGPWEMGNRGS